MSSKELTVSITKAQAEFLALDCRHPAYFGGLGAGKSYMMGLRAVLDLQHSENAIVGIYEPTHELVRDVAIPNVEFWLQQFGLRPGIDFVLNKNEHTINIAKPGWGKVLFKSMQDIALLIGYQTSAAHVDELDKLPTAKATEAWDAIVSRNRLALKNAPKELYKYSATNKRFEYINRCCAYSSPEGFKFCYDRWKRAPQESYQCVHGSARDNPALSEDYILDRCKNKSQNWIDAYIDGQFRNLASGTVYHCYDRIAHRSTETIREGETLRIGCDFNVGKTAATVYVLRNGGRDWHAVAELHSMLDTPEMIRLIKAKWQDKGHMIIMYPDSTGAHRHGTNAKTSHIAMLQDAGFHVRAHKKNPIVMDRVNASNEGFSAMRVFVNDEECPEAANCLEQQAFDKNGEPDKDSGLDHQNDATTYPLAYEMAIRKKIIPIDFKFMQKGALNAR